MSALQPLELWTKYGRRGRIKEPVGTHGMYSGLCVVWIYSGQPGMNTCEILQARPFEVDIDAAARKSIFQAAALKTTMENKGC